MSAFPARYPGRCADCRQPFEVGEMINRSTAGVCHDRCPTVTVEPNPYDQVLIGRLRASTPYGLDDPYVLTDAADRLEQLDATIVRLTTELHVARETADRYRRQVIDITTPRREMGRPRYG